MSAPTLQEYLAKPPHPARRQGGWRLRRNGEHGQPGGKANRGEAGTDEAGPNPEASGAGHIRGTRDGPLVSIITVVYNGQATLERAVRSVTEQTYPHIEYIVIDGGSTDGTLETIQRYDGRIALWLSEPDSGIFDAMNKGLALASGAYLAILNSDDYYPPRAVEAVVELLQHRPLTLPSPQVGEGGVRGPAEAVYGDSIFVLEDIGMEGRVAATPHLRRGMTLCHPALFVSRSVYERLGGYDLQYRYSADFDFALRLYLAQVKLEKVAEPLAYFTAGGAAERHLAQASWEAITILRRQAGIGCALSYALMFLKRILLRSVNRCIRALFGRRAYLWVKRRYYVSNGFKKQEDG